MKRQISHNQTVLTQLLFFHFGLTITSLLTVIVFSSLSEFGIIALLALSILSGILSWYYSTKFYTVFFDNEFVYFSKFKRTRKITIDKVISIKTGFFPFRFFYQNVYVLTIEYSDNDMKKKIKFLSKGATGYAGTVDNIPFLNILRQLIREKKYAK